MSHPNSFTAYRFEELNGNLKKVTVPWKDPEQGQVVVKVLACGVCASDELVRNQGFGGGLPRIPGHEIVGDVVAVHPSEQRFKVGDRVGSGWHGGHCGDCKYCRQGAFNICAKQVVNGINQDGGYAEYVTLVANAVSSVPTELDPAEAAPLFCAGVTTFNSLRNMDVKPGEIVAVQGIGGLGHLALQFSAQMGYKTVALSSGSSKKELATKLGAQVYLDSSKVDQVQELQKLGGAKVILCTAPSSEVIQNLLPALDLDGQLVILALPHEPATINLGQLIAKRTSIKGWPSGHAKDSEETVAFAQQAGVKTLIEKFSLEEAQKAYDNREKVRFRSVIVPGLQK